MSKGYLVLIGGGTDSSLIYEKMFELAGGKENSKMAIIPSASSHVGSTIINYEQYFVDELKLDKNNIWSVPLAIEDDIETINIDESTWENNAWDKEIAEKIKNYNIVFFVGGDQRRYIDALKRNNIDSPLLQAIENIYLNGGVIAGTSAGTNIISTNSIAGGDSEDALFNRVTYNNEGDDGNKLLILNGLGFIENIIFDTHFETRGRLGRLTNAALLTKNKWGAGISEKTAVIVHPDSTLEIIGYGDVLLVDLEKARQINNANTFLHVRDIILNLLSHGDTFNLNTKVFVPYKEKVSIINTPYFDANDYHISLNVFKEYETSHVLINYMLDNEAKDVIALLDYDKTFSHGDFSSFIRYVETNETDSWFCKLQLDDETNPINSYSGTNVKLDIIPLQYVKESIKPKLINIVFFGIENGLQVVVYENNASLPICDAKILIYDNEGLLFKKGSDRYGRAFFRKTFETGKKYTIKITYDGEEKLHTFSFEPDMEGICLC